jgi:hypothetical protein
MSVSGTKRTNQRLRPTSAIDPKRTVPKLWVFLSLQVAFKYVLNLRSGLITIDRTLGFLVTLIDSPERPSNTSEAYPSRSVRRLLGLSLCMGRLAATFGAKRPVLLI